MKGFSRYPPVLDLPGVADLLGLSIEEVRRLHGEGWIDAACVADEPCFTATGSWTGSVPGG